MTPKEWNALKNEAKAEAWPRLSEEEKTAIRILDRPSSPASIVSGIGHQAPSAKDYLAIVRVGTCYSTLRSCISLAFGLSIAAWIGWIGWTAFLFLGPPDDQSIGVVYLIISPIFIVFAVAAKQSSLLLVDLVDSTLDANRKK